MLSGWLSSTTLDAISPNISRKGKIFTTNGLIVTSEVSERRFLTSRQRRMKRNLAKVLNIAKMSSWTVDAGELIDQSQGRLLNVVSRIDANQPILHSKHVL